MEQWDCAHNIIQEINTDLSSWIHAHLHKIEGDLSNAKYWYARSTKNTFDIDLEEEYYLILNYLLN